MMPSIPAPQVPGPPPNPPMFGDQASGAAKRQQLQADNARGFGSTILGQGNPSNTGQKSLLGQ
jgi:hypothetical protein